MGDLRAHFRPEFLNRVDDIVLFKPLTLPEIEQIVDLQVADVRRRLAVRRLALDLTPAGRELIARAVRWDNQPAAAERGEDRSAPARPGH